MLEPQQERSASELQALFDRFAELKGRSLPKWIDSPLPSIWVDASALKEPQIRLLIEALKNSTLTHPHPLVLELKTRATQESLDIFVCKIFDLWRSSQADTRDKWTIAALGLLGSDLAAHKLGSLVCTWKKELKHQRVLWGLECLKAIATPAALMELHGIAQKTRYTALKEKANAILAQVSRELNLTPDELQDRIIPDCGLNERGTRVFDFGSRQFQLMLGSELKPKIRDASGKIKSDLPKPGVKDRADLAASAVAEWKVTKKQIAQVAKIQSSRLEQAAIDRRRWQLEAFESLLVRHPLMLHLTQRLVWGSYDLFGKLISTFRVTEDLTYATIEDEDLALESRFTIGVVHPLELALEERSRWLELLSDYEIVAPFPQMDRPVYRLEPQEETQTAIARFQNVELEAVALIGFLERRGWTRGEEHFKVFPGAKVTAYLSYDGVPFYALREGGTQSIRGCFFVSNCPQTSSYHTSRPPLPLGRVDPIVMSEVLADLTEVAAKC